MTVNNCDEPTGSLADAFPDAARILEVAQLKREVDRLRAEVTDLKTSREREENNKAAIAIQLTEAMENHPHQKSGTKKRNPSPMQTNGMDSPAIHERILAPRRMARLVRLFFSFIEPGSDVIVA